MNRPATASSAAGGAFAALGGCFLGPHRSNAHAGRGTDKGSYLAYALSVVRGLGVPVTEQLE